MKYFRGYVYVQLNGYAPERFLNLCGNRDILIWNLKPCEGGYRFCISVQGFRELKPILKKTRTKITILKRYGLPFTAFRYRKRKMYGLGFLLFGLLLSYLSGFVWNIEVTGNSYLSEETVLEFLEEEHAGFGSAKARIDCAALEEALRSRYDDVIWTSIQIYGTKLTVDIQENLLPEENYIKADDTVYDIVAAKDGIVSDIITRSGIPLVAAGSEIKEGDILVSGRLEILNDDGEVADYLYQSADADILAKVLHPYQDVIEIEYINETKTGESCGNYVLQIFGKSIKNPFFSVPYQDYTMISDTAQLHLSRNFFLPVFLTKETYSEHVKEKKSRSKEEIQKIATKNLRNYLADLEEKGIQIIEKNVMIEKKGKKYVAEGIITTYESVVSYKPTEMISITREEGQETNESD
ncbi:MAG: sporulation protein YqfD [Clostridiales bacterium]|nr:sporulation protein YqfD [Clostridiales bacterium]